MTINRSKVLRTVGWATVTFGLYLVGMSIAQDSESEHVDPMNHDDNIIDVDFTIIDE